MKKTLLAAAFAAGICQLAQAGIIAQLDSSSLTGAAGNTLVFNVTLTNTSTTDQVWLNGISSTASSPFLTIDTNPFDANAPLFLDPLASSGSFELFDVSLDPNTPAGPYIGSSVSILGGVDGGAGTAFDDLADIGFDVQIQSSTTTATPEPGTLWMLGSAALVIGLRRRSHRGKYGAVARAGRADLSLK